MKEILKNFFYNLLVKGLGGKRLKGVPDNLNNLLGINQELDYEKSIIDQAFGTEEDDEDEAIKKALDYIIKKSKNICIMDGIYFLNAYIKDVPYLDLAIGGEGNLLNFKKKLVEKIDFLSNDKKEEYQIVSKLVRANEFSISINPLNPDVGYRIVQHHPFYILAVPLHGENRKFFKKGISYFFSYKNVFKERHDIQLLVLEVEGYDSPLLITDKAQIEEVNSRLERMARWYTALLNSIAKNN